MASPPSGRRSHQVWCRCLWALLPHLHSWVHAVAVLTRISGAAWQQMLEGTFDPAGDIWLA